MLEMRTILSIRRRVFCVNPIMISECNAGPGPALFSLVIKPFDLLNINRAMELRLH